MSGSSTVVNLDDDNLRFMDSSSVRSSSHTFSRPPDSALDNDDTDDQEGLLGGRKKGGANFLSIEFYQQLFDVDTDDVKKRVAGALIPRPGRSFLKDVTGYRPDLYGPFWICMTLVVSVAVAGNLASYIQAEWSGNISSGDRWHYDFHKVTLVATAVFSYAWLVPSGIYAYLWWSSVTLASLSFLDLICLYGYSLAVYIPISVLWLIQHSAVQWMLTLAGAALSGGVIVLALYPTFRQHLGAKGNMVMLILAALHLLVACGFMLCFFHASPTAPAAASQSAGIPSSLNPIQSSHSKGAANEKLFEMNNKPLNGSEMVPEDAELALHEQKKQLLSDSLSANG